MKETQIQKQLNDFKCFKDHYTKMHLTVFDNEGHCTFDKRDIDTDRILVLADNPHQLCIAVQDTDHHGKIYHISNEARMLIASEDNNESSLVFIRDEDHTISILFDEKNWKNAEQ